MTPPAWRRYLRFWRADVVDDVAEELRFHTEMRVAEYVARGMSEADARRAVATRLGDVEAARAECIALGAEHERSRRLVGALDGLYADVRYALRALRRTPGWTTVALLTIALGLGASTAVFSIADSLLLNTMPYPGAARIYVVRRVVDADNLLVPAPVASLTVQAWRRAAHGIEAMAPFATGDVPVGTGADTVSVHAAAIDTAFLPFTGAHPLLGRNLTAAESAPNGPGAVMLDEGYWRLHFGAARDVTGRSIDIAGRPHTIVGIVPASVSLPDFTIPRPDLWLPLVPAPNDLVRAAAVRLRPGASPQVVTQELSAILTRVQVDPPFVRMMHAQLRLMRPQDDLDVRQPLLLLTVAVALLLLVACTNLAHLLLARGATRQQELAVRLALGADRARLVRQLVTEAMLIAVLGGALAAFLGWAALHALEALQPAHLMPLDHVRTGGETIRIAAALAIATGLAIGVIAALRNARSELARAVHARASGTRLATSRFRSALVIGEVALSSMLLVGALLLVHSVYDLERTRLGFDARHLYAISLRHSVAPGQQRIEVDHLRERALRLPGVEETTIAAIGWRLLAPWETPGRPALVGASVSTAVSSVEPDYFSVMGIPLAAGRLFDAGSAARHEAIVSESLARSLWPDVSPLGRQFRNSLSAPGQHEPWLTVVGVVPDVVEDLTDRDPSLQLYEPLGSAEGESLIVRFRSDDPSALLASIRSSLPPGAVPPAIVNLRDKVEDTAEVPRFTMRIMMLFALLAVTLAGIGLFGVVSYSVAQRTREIGVRMTLGATRGSIARLVLGDGARLAVYGALLGLAGAVVETRVMQSVLFGVTRLDPFSYAVGAIALLSVAVAACIVPMLRATSIDPAIAVRAE